MTTLKELVELAKAATPGPWKALGTTAKPCPIVAAYGEHGYQIHDMQRVSRDDPDVWRHMKDIYQKDAAYIAAASPDVIIALGARVEELAAALKPFANLDFGNTALPANEQIIMRFESCLSGFHPQIKE